MKKYDDLIEKKLIEMDNLEKTVVGLKKENEEKNDTSGG